jgi:flagellar hook protein FlgE
MSAFFGSLYAGVSGLRAQSQALGMISNNIANASTVGYKQIDASFSSIVTSSQNTGLYSPGSVSVYKTTQIDRQGLLQQTPNATDLAISGTGLFPVRSGTGAAGELLYTRSGSYRESRDGILVNTAGFALQGWPTDSTGNVAGNVSTLTNLVPVNLSFQNGLARATSEASITALLNASQQVSGNAVDFSRALRIYDSLGLAHDVALNFTKLPPTRATATGTATLALTTFPDPTATFDVSVGGAPPSTITLSGNVNTLLADLNAIPGVQAILNDQQQLVVRATNSGETLELSGFTGTPSAATTLGFTDPTTIAAPPIPTPLPSTSLASAEQPEGWWQLSFTSSTGTILSGAINFSNGTLNATRSTDGQVNVDLGPINWGNGAQAQTLSFDIANLNMQADQYNVLTSTQDGAPLGFRSGITIDPDGLLSMRFTNGLSRPLYRLPIVSFPSTAGLEEASGNVYRETSASGGPIANLAGTGGTGTISSGTLEGSTVDLAEEFSKLISTQRAYSGNTKVITTADEMLADLLRIR